MIMTFLVTFSLLEHNAFVLGLKISLCFEATVAVGAAVVKGQSKSKDGKRRNVISGKEFIGDH